MIINIINTTIFISINLIFLTIFLFSCYGLGIIISKRSSVLFGFDDIFARCLTISLGMGIFIVICQLLSILGLFNVHYLLLAIFFGLLICVFSLKDKASHLLASVAKLLRQLKRDGLILSIIVLMFVLLFISSQFPPYRWDEVMYHLPHAKEWAKTGSLTINPWIRYPYFPYNFNLLYAASLVFDNDILPHLIHASAAGLTIIGIYRLGFAFFDKYTALLATLIFIFSLNRLYANAYVELGLTMFIFFGFFSVYLGYRKNHIILMYIGAFLIGITVGIKYQAVIYLPLLAFLFFASKLYTRPKQLIFCVLLFSLPCAYWYVRNYILTGNPIEPLAGSIFGYHSWNATDMENQMADIRKVTGWPNVALWPALLFLVFCSKPLQVPIKAMGIFCIYACVSWYFTSHYARYLIPAFPFLSIFSANSIYSSLKNSRQRLSIRYQLWLDNKVEKIKQMTSVVILLMTLLYCGHLLKNIPGTQQARDSFLKNRIHSYEIGLFLQKHPEYRSVQIGLESDVYYLPRGTLGEVFGPYRYQDFLKLSTPELSNKIKALHANSLILSNKRNSQSITSRSDFKDYFKLLLDTGDAQLYLVK